MTFEKNVQIILCLIAYKNWLFLSIHVHEVSWKYLYAYSNLQELTYAKLVVALFIT